MCKECRNLYPCPMCGTDQFDEDQIAADNFDALCEEIDRLFDESKEETK